MASPAAALQPGAAIESVRLPLSRAASTLIRWLRADLDETVRMERRSSPRGKAGDREAGLLDGLAAWARAVRRRRAATIALRHLIAGLAIALLAEAVSILLGGERRAPWIFVPLLLGPLDGAIAARREVGLEHVAHMLDRCLGLHDRVVTALAIAHTEPRPAGLSALVADEGRAAVAASFSTARLRSGLPRRESAWLAGAVAALALLAAVPGVGAGHSSARPALPHRGRGGASAAGAAHGKPSVASRSTLRRRVSGTPAGRLDRPPLAVTDQGSHQSKGSGFSPYGHGGNSLSAKQLAREGIASPSTPTATLGTLAIGESSGSGSGSGAGANGAANAGSGKGTPAGGAAGTHASHGTGAIGGAGALASPGSHGAAALGGAGTKQAGAGAGSASSGSSPPGGNAAGSGAGSTALRSGLVPLLGNGAAALPLAAGYAAGGRQPSTSGEGISQTPNGGGSGGRSAHSGSGGSGSASSSLSVIPPAFNLAPTLDRGVVSSYFGSANQLTAGAW
jgi:hypothetical protein